MSSFDRRRFLKLAALAPLAACGYAPIYGENTPARALANRIEVVPIESRMGFEMRKRLTERLGAATNAAFTLNVDFEIDRRGLAISEQNDITRYNLSGEARFVLASLAEPRTKVLDGDVRAFAAYSATNSPYATRVAGRDARARLATQLADQIVTHLLANAESLGV